jgi:hypothetical protein
MWHTHEQPQTPIGNRTGREEQALLSTGKRLMRTRFQREWHEVAGEFKLARDFLVIPKYIRTPGPLPSTFTLRPT